MSLVEDSPVHSSSCDDLAAILDAELDDAFDPSSHFEEVSEEEDSSDGEDDGLDLERVKRQKLCSEITNAECSSSDGELTETIGSSSKKEICTHPGFSAGMCMKCGQRADDDSAIPLKYIDKNLRLANDEMARLRDKVSRICSFTEESCIWFSIWITLYLIQPDSLILKMRKIYI